MNAVRIYFEYDEANNLVLSIDVERPCKSCVNPICLIIQKTVLDLPTEIIIDHFISRSILNLISDISCTTFIKHSLKF
jgi:hypothetical protein